MNATEGIFVLEWRLDKGTRARTPRLWVERQGAGWIACRTGRRGAPHDWAYIVLGEVQLLDDRFPIRIRSRAGEVQGGPEDLRAHLRSNGLLLKAPFGRSAEDYLSAIVNSLMEESQMQKVDSRNQPDLGR